MKTAKTNHMVKRLTTAFSLVFSLAALSPATAQKRGQSSGTATAKPVIKFLDAIKVSAVGGTPDQTTNEITPEPVTAKEPVQLALTPPIIETRDDKSIETASTLQLKYAVLLDTEVEQIQNAALFSLIDEWIGTRYQLGGSTKDGIDCSAFVQVVYSHLFQIAMPRTAKEQYKTTRRLSQMELKQGDLLFFSTHGSQVTHVGVYLQNNKFVHASTSGGVMVSDMLEAYWVKRFTGAGRYEQGTDVQSLAITP